MSLLYRCRCGEEKEDCCDCLKETIDGLAKAYGLARNAAAGLTNHCEESGSTRKCEKELQRAEDLYRNLTSD